MCAPGMPNPPANIGNEIGSGFWDEMPCFARIRDSAFLITGHPSISSVPSRVIGHSSSSSWLPSARGCSQIDVQVRIGKRKTRAIIDSGANINYVNKKWCRRHSDDKHWTNENDGTLVQKNIHKAYISFKIGKQKRTNLCA
jgi:hypothetical protein